MFDIFSRVLTIAQYFIIPLGSSSQFANLIAHFRFGKQQLATGYATAQLIGNFLIELRKSIIHGINRLDWQSVSSVLVFSIASGFIGF